ncbi:MAG: hypothetical protein Q9218_002609 [Villophora microphyllina]
MTCFDLMENGRASLKEIRDRVRGALPRTVRNGPHNNNAVRSLLRFGGAGRNGNRRARFLLESNTSSHNAESPMSLQQFRFTPAGSERNPMRERMYVENRDPYRAEEYPSVSTKQSSEHTIADGALTDANPEPVYVNASTQWSRGLYARPVPNAGGAGIEEDVEVRGYASALTGKPHNAFTEERTVRHGKVYQPYAVSSPASSFGELDLDSYAVLPDWQFDAEAYLQQTLRQESRKDPLASNQENSPPSPAPPRHHQGKEATHNKAERRKGRILNADIDYTRFSTAAKFNVASSDSTDLAPRPSSPHEAKQKDLPLHPHPQRQSRYTHILDQTSPPLIPAREPIPRSPLAPSSQQIPATETGQRPPTAQQRLRKQEYNHTEGQIRSSHFNPIISHQDTPRLNFNPPPNDSPLPQSSPQLSPHPQPSALKQGNNAKIPKGGASLVLTDQEFPPTLSREGPGSRFPAHLLHPPEHSDPLTREVPDSSIISPTTPGTSPSSTHSPDLPPGLAAEGRRSSTSSLSSGWRSEEELPAPLPTPPPPNHPLPLLSGTLSSPPSSSLPPPLISASTSSSSPKNVDEDMEDEDEEAGLIAQAAAMNLLYPPLPHDDTLADHGEILREILEAGARAGSTDGKGEGDEWVRLTVKTKEWQECPFPGKWVGMFDRE